jgi:hypothetical protein
LWNGRSRRYSGDGQAQGLLELVYLGN